MSGSTKRFVFFLESFISYVYVSSLLLLSEIVCGTLFMTVSLWLVSYTFTRKIYEIRSNEVNKHSLFRLHPALLANIKHLSDL